jgi:acyl-CoA synthetase (NDP forming)
LSEPDLRALLDPSSIAIVGASADFTRINGRPLRFLLRYGYGGKVFPINPRYREIAGLRCFPSLEALPETPDLALIGLSAQAAPEALEACGRRGIRAAVVFSGGFGEIGGEGAALQERLVEIAERSGMALCGPNCLGFVNFRLAAACSFTATFDTVGLTPGRIAFVSQSGALGAYVYALARERGLGFSYYISSGNEAVIDFARYVEFLVDKPDTDVILGYLESARDGPALLAAAERALRAGKLLVMLKVGRSRAGARAARSHTGALAGSDRVYDAAFRQHGIIRAETIEGMLDIAYLATVGRVPDGPGVAVSSISGGAGVILADEIERAGLRLAELGPETRRALAALIPPFGSTENPVDTTAQPLNDPTILRGCLAALAKDPAVDTVIPFHGPLAEYADTLVEALAGVASEGRSLVLANWLLAPPTARRALEERGVPVFDDPARAVRALGALVGWRRRRDRAAAGARE